MLDYAAFPEQRQALIYQILQENGRVICSELASRLGVSEHTIRRDLHELSKDGVCKKVYGGAVIALPESEDITVRKSINVAKKSNIAQRCARMVKSGSCIFIDTGSTNLAMAEALPAELALTVVTNSPEIAAVLLKKPLFDVIMLGGTVQRSSGGCVGATAISQVQGILFDQGFIGGCKDPGRRPLCRYRKQQYRCNCRRGKYQQRVCHGVSGARHSYLYSVTHSIG